MVIVESAREREAVRERNKVIKLGCACPRVRSLLFTARVISCNGSCWDMTGIPKATIKAELHASPLRRIAGYTERPRLLTGSSHTTVTFPIKHQCKTSLCRPCQFKETLFSIAHMPITVGQFMLS